VTGSPPDLTLGRLEPVWQLDCRHGLVVPEANSAQTVTTLMFIDGTIESVDLKSARGKQSVFRSIVIRDAGGRTHDLKKIIVHRDVTEALKPGNQGRFYTFKTIDTLGMQGVRLNDGRTFYGHDSAIEKLMAVFATVNFAWLAYSMFANGNLPLIGAIGLTLCTIVFVSYYSARVGARRQFEADLAYESQATA
jgi:hypothetical protein